MLSLESIIIIIALLYVFSIIPGIWLRKYGKPYNSVAFTFHKIIALSLTIFTSITIYNLIKPLDLKTPVIIAVTVTAAFFLITFISGVLLSIIKKENDTLRIVHKISSIIMPVLTAAAFYLLINNG